MEEHKRALTVPNQTHYMNDTSQQKEQLILRLFDRDNAQYIIDPEYSHKANLPLYVVHWLYLIVNIQKIHK